MFRKCKSLVSIILSVMMILTFGFQTNVYAASSVSEAEALVEQAQKNLEQAKAKQKAAEATLETKKSNLGLKEKGSLGFFEYYGYTEAANVLKNAPDFLAKTTNIGAKGDATSLDNFKAIVPFLKEANTVRANEKVDPVSGKALGELKVSMRLIAIEEVHSNWSATGMNHASSAGSPYSCSENLAWGYSDPFTGWVDKEKKVWVQAKADNPGLANCTSAYAVYASYQSIYLKVGHYLNACDSTSKYVGFAVNQKGTYGVTHGQSLSSSANSTDVLSVADFEKKVNAYCNMIQSAQSEYDSAYSALQTAKSNVTKCQNAYDAAVAEYQRLLMAASGDTKDGWKEYAGNWMYFKAGKPVVGWISYNGKWYHTNQSGIMETGWKQIKNKWYYFSSGGAMQTGWLKYNNKWYYFDSEGAMQTGWVKYNNKWYYFNTSGVMQTGWVKYGNDWYYLKTDGTMATGWVQYNNNWYYLYDSGKMATDTRIGKYYINSKGVYVP